MAAAVNAHADLVRIQVSEFGLDPADPLYDPTYLSRGRATASSSRSSYGLNVIVSLQAEAPAGGGASAARCPIAAPRPTGQSWRLPSPGITGVMFELYNEPGLARDAASTGQTVLQRRPHDDRIRSALCTAVGEQPLVNEIRAVGADNVGSSCRP